MKKPAFTRKGQNQELKLLEEYSHQSNGFSRSFRDAWAEKPYEQRIAFLKDLINEGRQIQAYENRRKKLKKVI
jgi:hypothetical protein